MLPLGFTLSFKRQSKKAFHCWFPLLTCWLLLLPLFLLLLISFFCMDLTQVALGKSRTYYHSRGLIYALQGIMALRGLHIDCQNAQSSFKFILK